MLTVLCIKLSIWEGKWHILVCVCIFVPLLDAQQVDFFSHVDNNVKKKKNMQWYLILFSLFKIHFKTGKWFETQFIKHILDLSSSTPKNIIYNNLIQIVVPGQCFALTQKHKS